MSSPLETLHQRVDTICAYLKIPKRDLLKRSRLLAWARDIQDDATTTGRRWLIWNHERRMWWKRSKFGYTSEVNLAGRFTLHEATELTKDGNIHLYTKDKPEDSIVIDDAV